MTKQSKKLFVVTFGCQMNEADSELIAASFKNRGFELTDSLKAADAVVINTCTVRQRAEDKAISQIGRLGKWKLAKPEGKLFVVGCAAQKLGAKLIKNRFPFVDVVTGAKDIDAVDALVEGYFGKSLDKPGSEKIFESPISAFVTIMRGCSLKCSYCIVPSVRGEARFLAPAEILKEAKEKAAAGAKELVLLGQTVNAYTWKDKNGEVSFAALLQKVSEIDGVKRVRFMSPHPLYFKEDFFELLKSNPKVAHHVHLPVQSGSDRVLKEMRRGYTRTQYLELVKKLRAAAPDLGLTTDFIVGYPGETDTELQESLSLVKESGTAFAYCFKYSQRTDGAGLAPDLNEAGLDLRLSRLLKVVRENSNAILNERIGRIEEVLLETPVLGRTSSNFIVKLESDGGKPGDIIKAEITGAGGSALKGRLTT